MALSFVYGHVMSRLVLPTTNLEGRVLIITGSNQGLGLHAAIHLARLKPSKLILACRDLSRAELAKEEIIEATGIDGDKIEGWELDLASFDSVKKFAKRCEGLDRVDCVIENAGMMIRSFEKTDDGWEKNFQVNVVATGLLGMLLLPILARTATLPNPTPSVPFKPRLTILGSEVHMWAAFGERKVPGSTIEALNTPEHFDRDDRYNVTKLLDLFMTREMAKLPIAKDVIVTVCNPGLCYSNFRNDLPRPLPAIMNWIAWPTEKGAKCIAYSAVEPDLPSGSYISACAVTEPSAFSLSEEGKALEHKIWLELVEVWKGVAPEIQA